MDQRKKVVMFLIMWELHMQRMCMCTMLFVMLCTLAQRYLLRKMKRAARKRARIPANMTEDSSENEISTNETGTGTVCSPVLENQTSAAQNAFRSQSSRRKRKRSPNHDLTAGLSKVTESFKQVMENSNKNIDKLIECLNNNHEKDCKYMVDELQRIGVPVPDRYKALFAIMKHPTMIYTFKALEDDEEKMEFVKIVIKEATQEKTHG